ncbi:amino acid adenylation domain-containing protein [Wukongibacter sp. M2B1]|uniref:amino acid adenylation domain-containing protein n=1 Tax=Wukongibacter sp. M2B1 TaxID=3088895 RepID=UPI003D7BD08C
MSEGKEIFNDIVDAYPLTMLQEGMVFHSELSPDSAVYHDIFIYQIQEIYRYDLFKDTVQRLAMRHPILRTSFNINDFSQPLQLVHRSVDVPVEEQDIRQLSRDEQEKAIANWLEDEKKRNFKWTSAPLYRYQVFRISNEVFQVAFSFHHAILDGWSLASMNTEFINVYMALVENRECVLEELPKIGFRDYVALERQALASEEHKTFWKEQLEDSSLTTIPRWSAAVKEDEFCAKDVYIPEDISEGLHKLSREVGIPLKNVLFAAHIRVMGLVNGYTDVITGLVSNGRPEEIGGEKIQGLFLNTLPFRLKMTGGSWKELIRQVFETEREILPFRRYPLIQIQNDMGKSSLFESVFNFTNFHVYTQADLDIEKANEDLVTDQDSGNGFEQTNFPFVSDFSRGFSERQIYLNIKYDGCEFCSEQIEAIADYYIKIFEAMVNRPNENYCDNMIFFAEQEKYKLFEEWQGLKVKYCKDKMIHKLFEEQVKKTPNHIAIAYKDKQLTYGILNEKANQLARILRNKGIGPDKIVGIMVGRSLEMVVGIMGILKAGGAYLPIDSEYPKDRIDYMLKDSSTSILLTQKNIRDKTDFGGEVLELDDTALYVGDGSNLNDVNGTNDMAYVIYTSGSTGKPKGVMVEHASLHNLCRWHIDEFKVSHKDRAMKYAGFGFDASVWEIFPYMICGASLYIAHKDIVLDTPRLNQYMEESMITIAFLPTQMCEQFMELENSSLRVLLTGGDKLKQYSKQNYQLVNNYGPTENTVVTTNCIIDKAYENIPIGKPIHNTKIYIVNRDNYPQPIGTPGEICISGDGLARGYLHRTELTGEKFVPNPFEPGEKMYRTGDLGRWLPGGNIEFLGRIDHQVKIRGFRIELGEIESRLLSHPSIKEAIVEAKQNNMTEKYLCAYVVGKEALSIEELKEYLGEELPDYMIPSCFMRMEKIPLTANGKIDRKALPEPEGNIDTGVEYVAPVDEVEEKLVLLWQEILGIEKVGTKDNFFKLGGHSLKVTKLVSEIHKEFNAEVPLKEVFKSPTISQIAQYIKGAEENIYASIEPIEQKEYYPMSSAQKRLYILSQLEGADISYNMPNIMIVEGKIDVVRFEEAFKELVERHEAFRTSFETIEGEAVQKVHENVDFCITYVEATDQKAEEIAKTFVKPFNLSKAPLLRVSLVKIKEDRYWMMIDMHHIISDGVSTGIVIREFTELYEGRSLPELKIQYKDFSHWQNQLFTSDVIKNQENYWMSMFKGEIPVLDMPLDFQRPPLQSFEGDTIEFRGGKELAQSLKQLTSQTGSTLYMVLLAAYNVLLYKYTRQEDIIVGSPIAGRPHDQLQNIVGMFVNTLAMRNYTRGEKTFEALLKEVKENALKAYENQDYPFEELVDKLNLKRDMSRNPLFDTMFTMQNTDSGESEVQDLNFNPWEMEERVSKFDISLDALEEKEGILFSLEYCTRLFTKETMERIAKHFINILEVIAENPSVKISEINMLSQEEKQQLVYDFNSNKAEFNRDLTVHHLFEEHAKKAPNDTAILFEGEKYSYGQINEKANRIANYLVKAGLQKEEPVAVLLDRSPLIVEGILGIWKAGGAYIPIDPGYPMQRIENVLEESKVRFILSLSEYASPELENAYDGQWICLDASEKEIEKESGENLELDIDTNGLAYVIYTSGSTGRPKGAMIEHLGMMNHIHAEIDELKITKTSLVAQNASHCFDVSVWQFFAALTIGARIAIYPNEVVVDVRQFTDRIIEDGVTVLEVVPSVLVVMIEHMKEQGKRAKELEYLLVTGETVKPDLIEKWFEISKETKVVNAYGPAEASDDVTQHTMTEVPKGESIPIGKPIQNISIYIVDQDMKLCPVGVKGEICVSGIGVGRGYLNNPEKTKEVFLEDPFIEEKGVRLYKTGDIGRWLENGNIEFYGRKDYQVKIRGHRIELEEIETRILKHPKVKEAVVVDKAEATGEKTLCGYIVFEGGTKAGELREYLQEYLPGYMIPTYIVPIEKMPLSPNGKVDRKALPEPDEDMRTGVEYVAPRDETEEKLAVLWQEILGVERVGINDNFFEIGGHSLKATNLVSRIHKEFNVEVPLTEIFRLKTIEGLSGCIKKAETNIYASIEPVEEKEYYVVSSAQKRLYLLDKLEGAGIGYNIPEAVVIEGSLDIKRLEDTFKALINRHETLRTSFDMIDDEIIQRVHKQVNFKVEYMDMTEQTDKIMEGFVRPFDLSKAPLFRVRVAQMGDDRHALLMDMHHIISDAVSEGILVDEFNRLYNGKNLEELRLQYKDYSEWQNKLMKTDSIKKQEDYWLRAFEEEVPVLNMPADYPRPAIQSFEGSYITFEADPKLTERLKRLASEEGATMFMVLLAAYNAMLLKYTGQEDVVVGTPIAGRHHADLENIIGMFVNTLALRNYPNREKTFSKFLEEVKENALKAYENQDYQFEELVEKLDIKRDMSRNPLFDTMFSMQNADTNELEMEGFKILPYNSEFDAVKFDLMLDAEELEDTISFSLGYCTKLLKKETIEGFAQHFINILEEVTENAKLMLKDIDMLSQEEKRKMLYDFNDTKAEYPKEKTIQELFEEQVEKTPDNIAVIFENRKLSYRELNEKANQLSRVLRDKGVISDSIVSIMMERSPDMIIAALATLKAGGAYLPIDPHYPVDRITYMLENSQTRILLTQKDLEDTIEFEGITLCIDDESFYTGDGANISRVNSPENLAYIIYTSGTTGKPKGVMIEHRNVVRLMFNDRMQFDFNEKDVWTMFHSFCFDFSVWEMYGALLYGGKLVIVPQLTAQNTGEYLKLLRREKVTILNQTPTAFYHLAEQELKDRGRELSLRYVIFGGEALKPTMLKGWNEKYPATRLINMYGITETTVHVTFKEITGYEIDANISNIGKPIPTLTVYIMDKDMKLVPVGASGELCVGGEGVARGYLNNIELTTQKFVPNPYKPAERLYRSGDLARMLSDGEMEYMGRIDHQVKIRGFRIELGEIETRLLNHPSIKEALVLDREDQENSKYLCAYVVPENEITVAELREHLSQDLPDYMIPSYFIQLEKMPLTSNGKVDRKGLPELDGSIDTGVEYVAPRNSIEQRLAALWQEILGVERVGVNDNFFEIGGHSLKATSLVSKIHKEFNVELQLAEVFKLKTLEALATCIKNAETNIYASIEPVEEKEYYRVSSAQKRLYLLDKLEGAGIGYNIPFAMKIKGNFDIYLFEKAFEKLTQRHEALRTSFAMIEGDPVQKIEEEVDFKIAYSELGEESIEERINAFVKPFNLEKAPLLRGEILKINEDEHIMIFDMHHIISDGVSMGILTKELAELYSGKELLPLNIQYKDYSEWQREFYENDRMKKQEDYWLKVFKDEIPVLNMPTDYKRPQKQSFEGDIINFEIDNEITDRLNKIAKENGVTMYMLLLASYTTLLSKYTGQEDIIVGSPVAGRSHDDLKNVIGMFINTLAMRNYPKSDMEFVDYLKEVKENALKAYENQDYQFDELVEKLDLERDMSRSALFDTMFVLQNFDDDKFEIKGLEFEPYRGEFNASKFDLTLTAVETGSNIECTLNYCTKLFKKNRVKKLAEHLNNLLKDITSNPRLKLSEIDILSQGEKNDLLYRYNETKADYPKDKTIHKLFEEQAERTPDNIAVVFNSHRLTYRELNEKSNQLAGFLDEKGVKAGDVIGIMVKPSLEMIISIIAVLKIGVAYLPIDSEQSEKRTNEILKDSGAKILLAKDKVKEKVIFNGEVIDVEDSDIYTRDISNLEAKSGPDSNVYLIYTSGSTGKPKGVFIRNYNLVNYVTWFINKAKLKENDKAMLMSSYAFDLGYTSIYSSLLNGSQLHIVEKPLYSNANRSLRYIKENEITYIKLTPSLFNIMVNDPSFSTERLCEKLRLVVLGGEKINTEDVEKFLTKYPSNLIINHYGPTETTIGSVYNVIDFDNLKGFKESAVIGTPINNTKVYILDKNMNLLPKGIYGELCISGKGVAEGYLNRQDLTSKKFVQNPFKQEEIIYRTGDVARRLEDGRIELAGRIDNQVKIRGYRVETGEIEKHLLKHESIKETLVTAREDKEGSKYLCAYITSYREMTFEEMRAYLREELAEYMIPSYFVQLEKMPLTSNGKIDRKGLPEPGGSINTGVEYVAPRNPIEQKLLALWQEILRVERIGINDSFFALGGTSLTMLKVMSKIYGEFGIEVQLNKLYQFNTIGEISQIIMNQIVRGNADRIAATKIEDAVHLLNEMKEKKVFAFPPISTFGSVYKSIADLLPEYALYAFNYMEDKDKIEKYVNMIKAIQKEGPYTLIGYSAGGILAFDVAKALLRDGNELYGIVLIDSYPSGDDVDYGVIQEDEEDIDEIIAEYLEHVKEEGHNGLSNLFESDFFMEVLKRKIMNYRKYSSDANICREKINADIHVVKSEESNGEVLNRWRDLTEKKFKKYEGYGKHSEMIIGDFAQKNLGIFKEILKKMYKASKDS